MRGFVGTLVHLRLDLRYAIRGHCAPAALPRSSGRVRDPGLERGAGWRFRLTTVATPKFLAAEPRGASPPRSEIHTHSEAKVGQKVCPPIARLRTEKPRFRGFSNREGRI